MSIFSAAAGGSLAAVHHQHQPRGRSVYGLPDFDLSSLQNRIQIKDLEPLYKRYEQRAQIGECRNHEIVTISLMRTLFTRSPTRPFHTASPAGTFTTYLVIQTMLCILYIGLTAISCEMEEVSQSEWKRASVAMNKK